MTPLFVPKGTIFIDEDEKRRLESRNGVLQVEYVIHLAKDWQADTLLTPGILREMQRLAVNQIYRCAGHFRDGPVSLNAEHTPPPHNEVEGYVLEMCDFVKANWEKSPIFLSSYLMWRMNWIHPFYGGNGRTSRAVSYLILCAKLGFVLPGVKTIPELIMENRDPYYEALRSADIAWAKGALDITDMEQLMSSLLAKQLCQIHASATGKDLLAE